jgi:PAS domain S-box-containing protein
MINTDYHQQLFKVIPLPSVLLAVDAPKYTIVYVNDAYLKTTIATENDIIGKGISEVFPDNPNNPNANGVKALTLSLATTLQTQQPQKMVCQQYDIPIRGTDKFEQRYFDCENIPILNNNGKVEYILHTIVDVTEKVVYQQTSNTLELRNKLIENVLESLPFGIAVNKMSDGSTTMVNEQFSKIYGWDKEDLKDVPSFFEKVFPDLPYRNEITTRILADIQSGDAEQMNWSGIAITTKTGDKRIVNAKNIPLFDQDLMISTVTDVTKSTQQHIEINRIKTNQEALINGTRDLIWSIDSNYCLITANEAYVEIIEKVSHLAPKEGDSVFCEAFEEELNNKWRDYYKKGLSGQYFSVTEQLYNAITHRNDYQLISFNPMYNQEGKLFGVACYAKDITDDIQLQNALLHTKNKLSNVLDASLDVICVINEAGFFLQVSAAAFAIWGYKPDEMIGKKFTNFIYEKDILKTLDIATNVMAGKNIMHFENRYIHKDGSLVWMEWNASWDKQSKVRYGIARDISEYKKNEAALIASEKKYKNLFENNPSPMFIWDFKTLQIIDCNEEALLKYGYTREEFLQLTIKDIRPAEDIVLVENATISEEVYGAIHKQTWRHQKKNGDLLFMDISSHIFDYKGKRAALLVLIDVTEKLKVEAQIKYSESKYRSLVESSLDGILLTIKNGAIISANATACKIFQMTEEDICNAGRQGLVDMTDPRLPILLQERELTGKATGELTFKRKDGTKFPGEITSVVFIDINGEEKTSMTIKDITELKKVTAQKDNLLNVLQKSLNEIYIINPKTLLFEYANESGLKNLGYTLPQMLTMTTFDIKPHFTEASFRQLIQPLITKEKEKIVFETTHKRADNSTYDVEVHLQLVENDNQTAFLGMVLDITKRKKTEIALKNSEEKYKNFIYKKPIAKMDLRY